MNPEALAAAILSVLVPIADERRPGEPLALEAGDIVLERPRNREHGDWATNIAMRLAKQLGANPARARAADRRRARRRGRDRRGFGRRPRIPQRAPRGRGRRCPGEGHRGRGRGVRPQRLAGRALDQRRVRLREPDRAAAHRPHPLGGARRRDRAPARRAAARRWRREFYINDAGAQMERFAGSIVAAAQGEPTPEGGYAGSYIADIAARVLAESPDFLIARRGRAAARRARTRLPASSSRSSRSRSRSSTSSSTCGSRSGRCTPPAPTVRRASSTRPSTACVHRVTCSTRTTRSGCAPPISVTTRIA